MRVAYVSDMHIETRSSSTRIPWCRHYPLDLGPSLKDIRLQSPHVLVLAGDIGRGGATSDSTDSALYAQQASEYLGCPVVVVPGNHEYYGYEFKSTREKMLGSSTSSVIFLDRNEVIIEVDGNFLRILGATMWTDYAASGNRDEAMRHAAISMNDHRVIKYNDRLFTPADALREHRESRVWLSSALGMPHGGPTLIVTHHVPHISLRNPIYPIDHLTPAFLSDMSDVLTTASDVGVSAWIYGHHHVCGKNTIRDMRLLSAQVGYEREDTGFSGVQIIEV